jgi:KDO2-lipid IV(A) lauroyltransferase
MTLVEVGLALVCAPAVLTRRISVDGLEHLEAATAASRPGGVLVLTAHFGNWELAGLVGPLYGVPMATVMRPLDSPLLDRLARRLRGSTGVEMIDKREAFRAVTDALRRRQLVAILLDQNASRREGVFVPFFGRPASTSRGLALLSLRTGTPILPVFMHREPDGRHHLVIEPAIPSPSRGALGVSIEELTAACASRIEATVRRWPEQWLWLHRRWRTRPVGETTQA